MARRLLPAHLLAMTIVGFVIAPLGACSKPEGPQVAFLLTGQGSGSRYANEAKYFEARAHELGLRVVTRMAVDSAAQLEQVEDVLARGAKILVVQPTDGHAASTYVRLAHEKAAKVVAYDSAIVASDLDYYVSHDSYRVGVLQAEAALQATGGKGNYVLLSGQAGHPVAVAIMRGYKDTLAPYIARGGLSIVIEQYHSAWSPEQGARSVEDALARSGGQVDAVLANNSGLARGAVDAISAAGLDDVFIAGADAEATNVNFLCEGKQSIEVLKDVQSLARTAAEVAGRLFDGARVDAGSSVALAGTTVPATEVRVVLVTPGNVKALLVDTGLIAADEIPACKSRLAHAASDVGARVVDR